MTHARFAIPTLLLTLLAGVSCSGGGAGATAHDAASTRASGDAALAPEFELTALDGTVVRLSDSAGRVRLIDFWATWCAPCREEIPMLNELQAGYGDEGLTILAISDEDADTVAPFAEQYGMTYTNLVGGEETFNAYRAPALPTAFLLDGEGRIVQSWVGPKPRKILERKIRELLELPPST